ncbi:uncharacterized protein LOC131036178 [Cryptomeria japonica]|uniref:uncharacterized protein LOC131036178 n=1 Tax=Cryptomeria japonica TaxID=3369 RepID=UPI0027D9DA69|nr:uncharacterized protein LOC131036178 [Cryptomeria japonica]
MAWDGNSAFIVLALPDFGLYLFEILVLKLSLGPSGLSAAYALAKLGYENVTVLEKQRTVGGMCESLEVQGRVYDLGGQVVAANSAPTITSLVEELGNVEFQDMESHKLALIDCNGGQFEDLDVQADYMSIIPLTMKLQAKAKDSGHIGVHAVSRLMPDPVPEFFRQNGLKAIPKAVAYGYTASGYGFVEDMAYAYLHEFARTSMLGKIRRVKGGYASLWQKLSVKLPAEVQCGIEVVSIERDSNSVRVHTKDSERQEEKTMEFDKIIISGAIPFAGSTKVYRSNSTDMKAGFYDRLEELQGQENTYYVGGLMAFELTELNSTHAIDLVCKHFGSDVHNPPFPYVKRLFPLYTLQQKSCYKTKELDEILGVEFPDLATIDEYLHFWASHKIVGHKTLYSWINDEGKVVDKRTYQDIDARSSLIAKKLLTSNKPIIKPGDRVVLLHPPGLDFIDAFFGCLRARVLAVPLLPPDPLHHNGQALAKVESVAKSCNAVAILSTSSYHAAVRAARLRNMILLGAYKSKLVSRWPDLPWLYSDSWTNKNTTKRKSPGSWSWPKIAPIEDEQEESLQHNDNAVRLKPQPEEVCFLQFTSGSTGDAKGVKITNAGLVHNVKLMHRHYKSTSRTVLVSWLPQYHDMGLIGGLLTAMLSGGTAILFSPLTFIRNPLLWIDTMTKYKATHSAGPNFAFELVVRRLETAKKKEIELLEEYDLSSMLFLMISAEPVRQKTLRRFVELLGPCGLGEEVLAPGYGLAENSVFVSVAWGAGKPIYVDWQGRVCCGYVERNDPDVDIRIVDAETGEEVAGEGIEGEIWVSSPSAGIGYWGCEVQGEETFKNKLNSGTRNYTRTGDLGRIVAGRLFVTGRIKDLIIVNGRNVYSSDVEKTVETCSECIRPGCCAVIGVPEETLASNGITLSESSDQVGLVVIAEIRDEKIIKTDVAEQIRMVVAAEHGVEIAAVKLIKPRTICKTTSGKIRRSECLKQFTDGTLDVAGTTRKMALVRTFTGKADHKSLLLPVMKRSWTFNGSDSNAYSPIERVTDGFPIREDILQFLVCLVSEKTGLEASQISHDNSFVNYGLSSIVVVEAAQRLSSFLGVHVAAIDVYTAGCISELAELALNLMKKSGDNTHSVKGSNPRDLLKFLKGLVSEMTGVAIQEISSTDSLVSYGIDSVGVVCAAQKLSAYLGVHVSAVDIFTANNISELAAFAEGLLQREGKTIANITKAENVNSYTQCVLPSALKRLAIGFLQLIGILYAAALLIVPAYIACSIPLSVALPAAELLKLNPILLLLLASPAAWIFYIVMTAISLSIFGITFLQVNHTLKPKVSVWSVDFVKWWTLYRARDFASTMLATHLRGTVFILWWYRLLGADIGKDVVLDSTDITDPSMVSIADEAVISDGATLESHQVKNGMLFLGPVKIGSRSLVGPFALLQMGTVLASGSVVPALHRTEIGQSFGKKAPHSNLKVCYIINSNLPVKPLLALSNLWCKTSKVSISFACMIYLFTFCDCQSARGAEQEGNMATTTTHIWQLLGLYTVAMVSTLAAAMVYPLFVWLSNSMQLPHIHVFSDRGFLLFSLAGAFHWPPATLAALVVLNEPATVLEIASQIFLEAKVLQFAFCVGCTYIAYGFVLTLMTCILKWCIVEKVKPTEAPMRATSNLGLRIWFVHRLLTLCHQRFVQLLSGTESFCIYLKCLGAKIGSTASIRAINAIVDPDLFQLGSNTHLGDFSRIITMTHKNPRSFTLGKIQIGSNCVTGTQSLLLPGSTLQDRITLGALSLAPADCVLQAGGVYVGTEKPVMVNAQGQSGDLLSDKRILQMDNHYRKIVGNLAAHLAKTTLKVQSRYFHRLGVAGRGTLTIFNDLKGLPQHEIFSPGKKYPIIIRHSNSLSADDDARTDARGASIQIMRGENNTTDSLIDLTLKTGKAFYARTFADFFQWLVGGLNHREEQVKRLPHIRDAVWGSFRQTNSYTELHYYSNICRLFRSKQSRTDYYVKFKLRPADPQISEDAGAVNPKDRLLPPETGAIPRGPADTRPLHFLADDFRKRVASPSGVNYILQLQIQPVPQSIAEREEALDCTKPWDEEKYPYIDTGEMNFNQLLDTKEAEPLRFEPYRRCPGLDVIPASSSRDSASIDHGRSLVYDICQRLRTGLPLHPAWKTLLQQSDVGFDLSTCPCPFASPQSAVGSPVKEFSKPVSQVRSWAVSLWLLLAQPLLQTGLPYALLALAFVAPLGLLSYWVQNGENCTRILFPAIFLPVLYVLTGFTMVVLTVVCKWFMVGKMREGDRIELWSRATLLDTAWQAVRTVAGLHFVQLCRGSVVFGLYMKSLGSSVAWGEGAFVDSMEALLNPEMVRVERNGVVGRNAMLFGHVYEGGRVEYGEIRIEEGSCVGGRGVVMPGVCMEPGSNLSSLSLAMKGERVSTL